MIKSNSLRNLFIQQNKIIIDVLIMLGGKCYLVNKKKIFDLILSNNFTNSQKELYTQSELSNIVKDMIECNILKEITIKKVSYIYLSTRSIKEFLGLNSNVSLPNSLNIYQKWEHKFDFISLVAAKNNMNAYDFVSIYKANTLFDISNSKIEYLNKYFKSDVKKEIYTMYSLNCHILWGGNDKYAFFLDCYECNAQALLKLINSKVQRCEDSIKMLVSLKSGKEYMLIPKENITLYICVPMELKIYLKNFPIKSNYITIRYAYL